jgi:cold-inducible RNA-binding protein
VSCAKGPADAGKEKSMKLYVGNLSREITDAQLNELGTPFGTLLSASVVTERNGGYSKGFGFIEFSTTEEGTAAIAGLDGREVNGQALKVNEAKPRKELAHL